MVYARCADKNGRIVCGFVEGGFLRTIRGGIFDGYTVSRERIPLERLRFLAPVAPGKIVAVGKNYRDHAMEFDAVLPSEPVIFIKPSTAVIGPGDAIICPSASSRVDYECELAFVVSKKAKNVRRESAREYILGYTCLNDVTARDLQARDGQWTRAKGFDTFAPMGPVVTDEIDPHNVAVSTRLNGRIVQSANTGMMIWPVEELLEFISGCMTLNPGDVVTTGTPAGVGPMNPGDTVEVIVEGVGTLSNVVCRQ